VKTGTNNSAFGVNAMNNTTTGGYNTALGSNAMFGNGVAGTGTNNTAVGLNALTAWTSGDSNIAVGTNTLDTLTSGSNNIAIGVSAAHNYNGNGSIFIGDTAGKYENTKDGVFYLDQFDRASHAGDLAGALLYGTFNKTPAEQTLTVNGTTTFAFSVVLKVLTFATLPP
jgi:hypothetical protein